MKYRAFSFTSVTSTENKDKENGSNERRWVSVYFQIVDCNWSIFFSGPSYEIYRKASCTRTKMTGLINAKVALIKADRTGSTAYSLRPEISVPLKFHFAVGIWSLSVILSWVLVQFLLGGFAGVWEVISFKDFLRCICAQNTYIARVHIPPLSVLSRHIQLVGSNGPNRCTRKFNSETFTLTHCQHPSNDMLPFEISIILFIKAPEEVLAGVMECPGSSLCVMASYVSNLNFWKTKTDK